MTGQEPNRVRGDGIQPPQKKHGLRGCIGRWPLFATITVWVAIGAAGFLGLTRWWGIHLSRLRPGTDGSPELVRLALTVLGGVGAVGYLVIKYQDRQAGFREEVQKDKEIQLHQKELAQSEAVEDHRQEEARQARLDTQVGQAVTMLGDQQAASTRIAGVYALADIADQNGGMWRQRVVDILCGYLRTERHHIARDEKTREVTEVAAVDGPVESTVLALLARHLRKQRPATLSAFEVVQEVDDDQLWCDCDIDIHGAVLTEPVDWSDITVNGDVRLDAVHFRESADFGAATFHGAALFQGAHFYKEASFLSAAFERAFFLKAVFDQGADFHQAVSHEAASFIEADFHQDAAFGEVTFRAVAFEGARFRKANFERAVFQEGASFELAVFHEAAIFTGAALGQSASFYDAAFPVGMELVFPEGFQLDPHTNLPDGAVWVSKKDQDHEAQAPDSSSPGTFPAIAGATPASTEPLP